MSIVLIMLTIDSLSAISPGGSHVPPYTVINHVADRLTCCRASGSFADLVGTDLPADHTVIDTGHHVVVDQHDGIGE